MNGEKDSSVNNVLWLLFYLSDNTDNFINTITYTLKDGLIINSIYAHDRYQCSFANISLGDMEYKFEHRKDYKLPKYLYLFDKY